MINYLRFAAMIVIMTSKRANLSDPRVRQLADEIIAAQEREIAEMKVLIASLEKSSDTVVNSQKANEAFKAVSSECRIPLARRIGAC